MAKDILTDQDGDMTFLNGDLDVGYSDEQHVEHIIESAKGHFKQHPLIGVGLEDYLRAPMSLLTRNKIEKEIALQLQADNAKNVSVEMLTSGELNIKATYE